MTNKRLLVWVEGTIVAALAMVLSYIPSNIGWFDLAYGLIPIFIYCVRRGMIPGLMAGLLWGVLHIVVGKATILTIFQGLLEYPVAFMVAGFAGIFSMRIKAAIKQNKDKTALMYISFSVLIGVSVKYFVHFLAGVIFWGQYAQWGLGPIAYSMVINGGSLLLNLVGDLVIMYFVFGFAKQLFIPKEENSRPLKAPKTQN